MTIPTGPLRWLAIGVVAAALLSGALLLRVTGQAALAAGFGGTVIAAGALLLLARHLFPNSARADRAIDWSLVRIAAQTDDFALAVTDRGGRLVCSNTHYDNVFGAAATPPGLPVDPVGVQALTAAGRVAWRDGKATASCEADGRILTLSVERAGEAEDCLLWRFSPQGSVDRAGELLALINSEWSNRLGEAGIMIAAIGADGRLIAASRVFSLRATGTPESEVVGLPFVRFIGTDPKGIVRFVRDGPSAVPLRLFQIAVEAARDDGFKLIALIDDDSAVRGSIGEIPLQTLLAMLPLGLALADRDGRFLYLNEAFQRAANVAPGSKPVYPGDLVIREDKGAVADAVRRMASGHGSSGDIAVRLRDRPDEPVALTIAGARGVGDAAVLLSLKDNSEESRLQREVAQAIKMQAVGQLAGGVAHDFNNILTAVIGHCDLMLMRHTPGDSDYDDIQQIRINSNRAAALTRQLLAFSRQQTLRPQILQLPDIISEVSNLLQRLLGETVKLTVAHGRGLGAVRADPGQLEQVIVNLAVNARDAMPGGGALVLRTFAVSAAEVPALGRDIMPVGDYTALMMADTGMGIAPDVLGKIFEPFFTTKEVGKGTGLGLSTVYGIVKQSNGFIFADSVPGQGTSFTVYLPVHDAVEPVPVAAPARIDRPTDLWGTGTVLLVEDEDMVRAIAERALTRHGYTVITAGHGEEALDMLNDGALVDLLVTDVVMPTMDGPTLVRHARKRFPNLPILFMSGYAEEQLRKSIDIDRVAFLPKPFSVKQLAEAAHTALAGHVD